MVELKQVRFESMGTPIVGTLYLPKDQDFRGAVILTGPLSSVKEQISGTYARALAERSFVALAIDHRFYGESGGEPRQYESPPKKIAKAARLHFEKTGEAECIPAVGKGEKDVAMPLDEAFEYYGSLNLKGKLIFMMIRH